MVTDKEMLERIAKLSSAIERQKTISSSRGRGSFSRGRGGYYSSAPYPPRNVGNMSLSNRTALHSRAPPVYNSNKYVNPSLAPKPSIPVVSHNKTFVANHINPSISASSSPTINPKSRNKQLIINDNNSSTIGKTVNQILDTTANRKQMSVDGVDFVVKGKKLIRKDLFDSKMTKTNLINNNSTVSKVIGKKIIKSSKRRDKNKNMVIGTAPTINRKKTLKLRDQKGNLVFIRQPEGYVRQGRSGKSLVLNSQKRAIKKARYCGFYTRYGKCPNAARCPFVHDHNRRAICPRFLNNSCKKSALECKLSHLPNPHIMPHCVHFQKNRCSNDPCMYMHVKVSKDAPVCRAFAMEGYCQKGQECDEKHVHVCPEFAETGKCSNANCRLPHVARRQASNQKDGTSGIAFLGSWVSSEYFHAQKAAKAEKQKAIKEAAASKVWTRPSPEQSEQKSIEQVRLELDVDKEKQREKEEQQGFVRLFDDSDDDDGWSQYERNSEIAQDEINSLRFNDKEDDEEDEEEEDDDEDEDGDGDEGDEDEDDEDDEEDDTEEEEGVIEEEDEEEEEGEYIESDESEEKDNSNPLVNNGKIFQSINTSFF